jgi:glycerophosphoryl diester phosphodiesterase
VTGKRACLVIALALAVAAAAGACSDQGPVGSPLAGRTFIATHRGDPALPENTLAAFRSALDAGADYLETDLVPSKDGVLVLRHDRQLSPTTDVEDHPEFADRRATKTVNGQVVNDWWVEDFTVAELATLRATIRGASPSGDYRIPPLNELIDFARAQSTARGRRVGLYLETKQPEVFRRLGYDLEDLLAKTLRARGLDRPDSRVYVQSWDAKSVHELSAALRVPAVQLISTARHWNADISSRGLRRLHDQGDAAINVVDDRLEGDPGLIARAHAAGLAVHGWGFERGEDYGRWISAGIDGIVTDDVRAALAARE